MASKARRKKAAPKKVAAKKKPAPKVKAAAKKKPAVKKKVVARKPAAKPRKKVARSTPKPKDGRPPNWPALSPYMTVRDAQVSLDFYAKAFGFKSENEPMRDAQGTIQHAGMRLGEACIMFAPMGMGSEMRPPKDSGGIGLSLYVYVADIDKHHARAAAAGAEVLQAPANQFWGDRIACYVDPDGYHWTFATNVGEFDASKAPH